MTDMSDTSQPPRIRGEFVLVGAALVLILGAVFYMLSSRQQALRSSPVGLDGLQVYLSAKGTETQNFAGGWRIDQDGVGLLIVPLFDTDLRAEKVWPKTRQELLMQQDEFDLSHRVLDQKRKRVPTLVVLPKWRSGMRLTGIGHPVLLNSPARTTQLLRRLTGDSRAEMIWARVPFTEFDDPADPRRRAKVYAAQMADVPFCTPLIGRSGAVLLARCPIHDNDGGERDFLLLTDPDLLNNHGLRLGDNGAMVSALIADLAQDRRVIIDYSTSNWLFAQSLVADRERTWEDLGQFFAPPFTLLWVSGTLLLLMTLWRASMRYGPARDVTGGPGASKLQAVAARARLMRLAGQDGAMLADYGKARIATTGARLFGAAHAQNYASEEGFVRYVKRRRPEHAAALEQALANLRALPPNASPSLALQRADDLERVLERIAE